MEETFSELEEFSLELLQVALDARIPDIHILPDQVTYKVFLRMNSGLKLYEEISYDLGLRLIAHFKYLGDMDIGDSRRPQSGACKLQLKQGELNLRLSTMTNFHANESLVLRLMTAMQDFDLASHTFFPDLIPDLERLVKYDSGLILFSGPVGSGKTTTMYQLLRQETRINPKKVICIEDPVEIEVPDFLQIQVNHKAGITYNRLLKQCLRHHPDIIVVGEIRDEETAQAVIRSALTGHLILATVHAKNAEGVVDRLEELGVSRQLLRQVMLGVVFQKMIPRYCTPCQDNAQLDCDHIPTSQKKSVLFDVRTRNLLSENKKQMENFNYWMRKALKNGSINQESYDRYCVPEGDLLPSQS